jgi:tRNA threonylcarbamoyladenosine biosynthesis protein TsaE
MKKWSGTGHVTSKPEETRSIAAEFARNLPAGTVLSLVGDLGAGKTEFVKGLAIGLGFGGDVTSPTFTILHEYRGGRLALFHMDFYRLQDERELDEIGLEEYLRAGGVCAIEWGDKFQQRLPIETVTVRLTTVDDDQRQVVW